MIGDELLYSLILLLIGLIALLLHRNIESYKKDQYLTKISSLLTGVFCILVGFYLFFKAIL